MDAYVNPIYDIFLMNLVEVFAKCQALRGCLDKPLLPLLKCQALEILRLSHSLQVLVSIEVKL